MNSIISSCKNKQVLNQHLLSSHSMDILQCTVHHQHSTELKKDKSILLLTLNPIQNTFFLWNAVVTLQRYTPRTEFFTDQLRTFVHYTMQCSTLLSFLQFSFILNVSPQPCLIPIVFLLLLSSSFSTLQGDNLKRSRKSQRFREKCRPFLSSLFYAFLSFLYPLHYLHPSYEAISQRIIYTYRLKLSGETCVVKPSIPLTCSIFCLFPPHQHC